MRKLLSIFLTLAIASFAFAEESWFGFYLQGAKVGYVHYTSQPDPENKDLTLRKSNFIFDASMLGQSMKINVQSWSWLNKQGRLVKSRQLMDSGGRTNDVTATFGEKEILATMITAGDKTTKTIPIPEGAVILDDPLAEFANSPQPKIGATKEAYVFAPDTMTLQKVKVIVAGPTTITDQGKTVTATHIIVDDPRAKTELFLSSKGDLIKATGPLGMEYRPEPKEIATNLTTGEVGDLAIASSIPITGRPDLNAPSVRYRVTGTDLSHLPQGPEQAVKKDGNGYLLWVKPVRTPNQETLITEAAKQKPEWTESDIRVPSSSPQFKKLAQEIVLGEKRVVPAALKLRQYVFNLMDVNAGIGVMRDANEILESKEGVCRDHAILLGTLTRAAGIPTRFISGLVYTGQDFLYHAWVEVWDGKQWVGLDSTRPADYVTPGHIKTAQGTVGDGLTGFLLDGAKFEVIKGAN